MFVSIRQLDAAPNSRGSLRGNTAPASGAQVDALAIKPAQNVKISTVTQGTAPS